MILVLLAACGGSADPGLLALRTTLQAWEAGEVALAAGDPVAAQAAFERALVQRPDDPLLLAWSARARADAGDLAGALDRIDAALALSPDAAEFRYNRAAWLARSDRPDEAAVDLRRALDGGARAPRDVLGDSDFSRWLTHPAFSFLPSQALTVAVDAPTGTAFWGSEIAFRLRVVGAADHAVTVVGNVTGPLDVVSAVEEVRRSTDGPIHDLTWQLRVTGAGSGQIGPLVVSAGAAHTEIAAVTVDCSAPPGKEQPPSRRVALWVPDAVAGAWTSPSASRAEGLLWVKSAPGDRIEITPRPGPPVMRLETRVDGTVEWTATAWESGPAQVRVVRVGAEAVEVAVP